MRWRLRRFEVVAAETPVCRRKRRIFGDDRLETANCGNRRSAGGDDSRGPGDDSLSRGDAQTAETTVRLRRRHCASAKMLGAEF